MTVFKKVILSVLVILSVIAPALAFADNFGLQDAAGGTQLIGSSATVDSSKALPELIGKIIAIVLSFVGVIFFILILYAGLLWMIAFGNSERVDSAKSIIEHAAIGLVIVLAAYAISTFVFSRLTSISSSQGNSTSENPGCCSNYETGNRVQTLQANCSGATRTWVAGSCPTTGLGCCSNSATGNSVATFEEACSGATRTWVAGPCP